MCNISVLLPVATSITPSELRRAHRSVVNQTEPPSEIVLVTNQPLTDDIEETIAALISDNPTTHHEHVPTVQGLGNVLQAGLQRCSEPYVARMDADDISETDRFAEQQAVLADSNVDIVGSHLLEFNDDPDRPKQMRRVPTTHAEITEWMAWRNPINHPTVMFDRLAVLEVGGYRDIPMMEDWDLWARCLATGLRFRNLDRALVRAQTSDIMGRRGGLGYARAEIRMARKLRKLGIASRRDTIQHLIFRVLPRILPAQLRQVIYREFAR